MGFFESFVLGALQGLTEFLPVSSSGHLTVGQYIFSLKEGNLTFNVATHVGTVLSVVTVYRKTIGQVIYEAFKALSEKTQNSSTHLLGLVFIGSLPTAIIGLVFLRQFEQMFESLYIVAVAFSVTGLILFITQFRGKEDEFKGNFFDLSGIKKISYIQALLVGLAQAFAITPGISRAGTTIAVGLLSGLDRRNSALLSFMLAIPAILGAGFVEAYRSTNFNLENLFPLLFGLVVSYVFGLIGLLTVLSFVKKGRLHVFSYYLWILSSGLLMYLFIKG